MEEQLSGLCAEGTRGSTSEGCVAWGARGSLAGPAGEHCKRHSTLLVELARMPQARLSSALRAMIVAGRVSRRLGTAHRRGCRLSEGRPAAASLGHYRAHPDSGSCIRSRGVKSSYCYARVSASALADLVRRDDGAVLLLKLREALGPLVVHLEHLGRQALLLAEGLALKVDPRLDLVDVD